MNETSASLIIFGVVCILMLIIFNISLKHEERRYKRQLNRKTNEVIAHINSTTNNTIHEIHQLLESDNNSKIDKVHIDNLIEKYTKEIDSLNTMDSGVFGKEDLVELCETFIINLRGIINNE